MRSVQLGLRSIRIFLISFFLRFFLSLSVFFFTDSKDSRKVRGNHYFPCIPLPPAHKHSFSSSRFLQLVFNQSICNYLTDSWRDLFSLEICILFPFSLMQLSRSYWLWKFKVTIHCEDLNSYETNTLLLQRERLNQLRLTPLATTFYISHLPNPTPSHHLSSIRLPNCMRDFF